VANQKRTSGERAAVSNAQARGGSRAPVDGIDQDTSLVNPDSGSGTKLRAGLDAQGASAQGGMAGPVGYFEGEGNEGPVAPVGGATTKSAADGETNSQGGVASGAPG
jgi:hypothetical protein